MVTIKNGAARRACAMLVLSAAIVLTGCMPSGPRALLAGKKLIEEGQYAKALEKLRIAVSLLPTNALAWDYYGLACHYSGDVPNAVRAYQRAVTLDRDLVEAHYNLGCLWLEQNNPEAAEAELTTYVLNRGNSAGALAKLGQTELRLRELVAAEKSFSEALRLDPRQPEALNGLGLVRLRRGRAAEAADYFKRAASQKPDCRAALLNLAIVQDKYLKQEEAALENYERYLDLKPAPSDAEAVAEVARQLRIDLHPEPRLAPPPASSATNHASPAPEVQAANEHKPPAPPPENSVPQTVDRSQRQIANHRPSEPAVASTPSRPERAPEPKRTSPAPLPQHPAPAIASLPSRPPEAAKPRPEPDVKPPQEIAVSNFRPRGSPAAPLVSTSSLPAAVSQPDSDNRGFFRSLNPLSLIRGGKKPQGNSPQVLTRIELAPAGALKTEGLQARTGSSAPQNGAANSKPRYRYKSPAKPAPGNHTAAEVAFRRGLRAYEAKRPSEAAQDFYHAIELDPSDFDAYYNLGLTYTDTGNLPGALTAYEYALAIEPSSEKARYNFALVLKRADYDLDALKELDKILAAYPKDARAHLALGNLYAQDLHQPAEAREHYRKVLEIDPRHPNAEAIRYWLAANP